MVVATGRGGEAKHTCAETTHWLWQPRGAETKTCVDIALKVVATRGREKNREKCSSHAMKSCAEIRGAKNKDPGRDKLTLRRSCGDQGRRRTNRCVDTTQRLWRPTVARKNEICRHYVAVVTTEGGETNRNALKLRNSFGDRARRNKRNALTPRSVAPGYLAHAALGVLSTRRAGGT